MAKVFITEQYLQDVADAIRSVGGGTTTFTPGEMAAAILSIASGCTASAEDVIASKTAISGTGPITGTMESRDAYTEAESISVGIAGDTLYARIPKGAYVSEGAEGYPEITAGFHSVVEAGPHVNCSASTRISSCSGGVRVHPTSAGGSGFYSSMVGVINAGASAIITNIVENGNRKIFIPGWVSDSYV